MNPETKEFEQMPEVVSLDDRRLQWPQFKIGQPVEINGVQFAIRKVTKKDVILRPIR